MMHTHLVDKKSVLDFVKSVATTIVAVATVSIGACDYLSDRLDEKIEIMAEQTAIKTFEVFRIEDATFELEKEHDKYLNGKSDSIRKKNLELVLKYRDGILDKHPEQSARLEWAISYYQSRFVNSGG